MRFEDPLLLLLLFLLPLWIWRRKKAKRTDPAIVFPGTAMLKPLPPAAVVRMRALPFALRVMAAALLIVALARPQSGAGRGEIHAEGVDIMLAVDTSTSMDITDMDPTRLEAAKAAMRRFIANRKNDRIGLVAFAGTSFTQCPLTLDYASVESFIAPLHSGMVEDGTAIGMAIATAVTRLKASTAKSRIVVLLTDGMNNRGIIDPETAAALAAAEKVKVYTIGIGTRGVFNVMVDDPVFGRRPVRVQSDIDDVLLRNIATTTGGRYFSAQNEQELASIYAEIDRLEKSELKSTVYRIYTEQFALFAGLALLLILLQWVLEKSALRSLPS